MLNRLRHLKNIFPFIILLLIAFIPARGWALTDEYQKLFNREIFYYDPAGESDVCATILEGKNNEEKVWNFLISEGELTAKQTAGVMGNMQAEAHFEPRLVEYGWKNSRGEVSAPGQPSSLDDNVPPNQNERGQPGYGIVQWTSPNRKQGLADLASKEGLIAGDLGLQLKYLLIELKGSYSGVYNEIKSRDNLDHASDVFMTDFESPADQSETAKEYRRGLGRDILTKYGSTTSSTGPGTVTCDLASGNAATLAKQLLDASKVGMDSEVEAQIKSMADGKGACPDVSGEYIIDVELLRVLVTLSKNNSFTMSSLHRGCTSDTVGSGSASKHWRGKAADISGASGINGVTMPSFSAHSSIIQKFVNQARNLLPKGCELGVPNNSYITNAQASGNSPCTNIFLDTPSTTDATGPHVHIGVP